MNILKTIDVYAPGKSETSLPPLYEKHTLAVFHFSLHTLHRPTTPPLTPLFRTNFFPTEEDEEMAAAGEEANREEVEEASREETEEAGGEEEEEEELNDEYREWLGEDGFIRRTVRDTKQFSKKSKSRRSSLMTMIAPNPVRLMQTPHDHNFQPQMQIGEPFRMRLGCGFAAEALEQCVKSMHVGEVARFLLRPDQSLGFVRLELALREQQSLKRTPSPSPSSSCNHHHHLDKQHLERHHHETTTTSLSMVGKNGDKSSIPTNLATAMGTATSVEGVERGGGGSSSSNGTTTSGRKDNQMLLQNLISKTTDSRGRSRLRVAGRFTSQAALAKAIMETVPTTGISHKSSNRSDKSAHSGDDLIALIQPSSVNSQLDQLEASDDELMFDAFSTRRIKRMRSNDPDDEVGGVAALRGKRSKPGTPSPLESNGRSGSPYPLYYSSSYPHHHHHHHHNPAAIATTTTRDNNNGGSPSFKPRTVPQRSSLPDMQKRARDMMRWISMLQIDMAAREGSAIMDESMDGKERRRAVLEQAEQVTKMLTVWQRKWESLETGSLPNTS